MIGAESILIIVALIATLVSLRGIGQLAGQSPVVARLRLVYSLIALLLAFRLLLTVWAVPPVVSVLMIVAAWLPFAVVRLAEELVRRHAPRIVKFAVLGGAIVFTVLALTFGLVWSGPAIGGLAIFQASVLVTVVIFLWRNRASVSRAERRAADMFALALVMVVPLVLTDFQTLFPDLPVRGGVFAALLLLLATSRLLAVHSRPAGLFADMAMAAGVGAIMALTIYATEVPHDIGAGLVAAAMASAALVLLIERYFNSGAVSSGLIEAVAHSGMDRSAIIGSHPLLDNGILIEADALADLPAQTLAWLEQQPVIGPDLIARAPEWADAAYELLDRYSASHLLRLSSNPPLYLAIMAGTLGDDRLDSELVMTVRILEHAK